jgi:cytochrome b subunit of formate dehydrogenase
MRLQARAEQEEMIVRYSMLERVLHWSVAITFIYLMLSGFALGYPRMAWLYDILGGGQTHAGLVGEGHGLQRQGSRMDA